MSRGTGLTAGSVPEPRARATNATGGTGAGPATGAGVAPGAAGASGAAGAAGTGVGTGPTRPAGAGVAAARSVLGTAGRPVRAALGQAVAERFRLHGHDAPPPGTRRLAVVSGWAGILGFGGVLIALRLLVNLFLADGGWYRPTVIAIGTVGVFATVGAFASIHRHRLPWFMLGIGTAALVAAFAVTAAA